MYPVGVVATVPVGPGTCVAVPGLLDTPCACPVIANACTSTSTGMILWIDLYCIHQSCYDHIIFSPRLIFLTHLSAAAGPAASHFALLKLCSPRSGTTSVPPPSSVTPPGDPRYRCHPASPRFLRQCPADAGT